MVQTIGSIPFGTQLDWLWAELQGPEKKTWQNFLTNPNLITPQDFATAFENTYERADGKHLEKRKGYAKEVFGAYNANKQNMLPENVTTAVDYLTKKGMSLAQATGVVGNLMAESGFELDPDAYNPSEGGIGAYGIAQWRGSRQKGLQDYYNRMQPQQTQEENNMQQQPNNLLSMLQGGLGNLMKPQDENELFTRGERFAMALDPLIHPNFRQGDAIAKRAAASKQFRMQQGAQNRTAAVLKQAADAGDEVAAKILLAVENKLIPASEAMKLYYKEKFSKSDKPAKVQMYEYALNTLGKTPEEAEVFADTAAKTTINTGATIERLMAEQGIEYTNKLYSKADTAAAFRSTLDRQLALLDDPNFDAGAGSFLITGAKSLLNRFGFEGADPSSNQEFVALMNQQILNNLGGSLGVGVSNADVMFLEKMTANPDMSPKAIERMLLAAKALLRREEELRAYARKWMNDNNVNYISDPYKFRDDAKKYFDNKPLEFPRGDV
tara:strand:+ start:4286 stop:5773 length:1488 start_codon:yes stop_codon:yes gene_type:complete